MAVIAIDWDNTLMNGKEWLPGAQNAIRLLRERGHKVIIWSCNEKSWIQRCLDEAGIPVDWICEKDQGKPVAALYVDDHGFHFEGDWSVEVHEILKRLE